MKGCKFEMKFLMLAIVPLLFNFSSGLVLECFFDNELLFDDLKVSYTCTVLHLLTNTTRRNVSEVSGKHIEKHDNTDITQLYIIHQQMVYFPKGFTKFFENIVAIHAGMNKLKYLERNDLDEFAKIRYLYLYSNQLEVLQSDVFESNLNLEYVSFYNNRLKHIGSKLLMPLKSLKAAYFNKNICIDKQAASEQGMSELKLEIAQQCSDITDEDLMNMLKENHLKVSQLEESVAQMTDQLATVINMLNELKADNKTD